MICLRGVMFERKKPCKTCPFRKDAGGIRYLGTDRATEIADSLLRGESFTCHDDLDKPAKARNHCAGAATLLIKLGKPNQMMQVCSRLGYVRLSAFRHRALVFDDFKSWITAQRCVIEDSDGREVDAGDTSADC